MNSQLSLLARMLNSLFLVMLTSTAQSEEGTIPTVSTMKLEFDILRVELLKPVDELHKKYEQQLNQLMDKVTQAGNLEKALVLKAELAGFRSGETKPADGNFPELKRLQEIYADAHAKRLASANNKLGQLIVNQQAKLLALQTQLTKEKKLEEALKANNEVKKMQELAKLLEASNSSPHEDAVTSKPFRVGSPVEALTSEEGGNELATVKVENENWGILSEGAKCFSDADYKWENIPPVLKNFHFTLNGKHSHTLKFEVEKTGLVYIATSDRFPQSSGSGESWEKEALDLKGLSRAGWRQIRQFDGMRTLGTGSGEWRVFFRECTAGESHSLRTEKYSAPVLLMRPNKSADAP